MKKQRGKKIENQRNFHEYSAKYGMLLMFGACEMERVQGTNNGSIADMKIQN